MKPITVREELLKRGIRILTSAEFGRLFPGTEDQISYFLEAQTRLGLFIRLKKGLYALKTDLPGEEEIANRMYQPSYLSFEYALAFYNILPEMPYVVTSATTKPTRNFEVDSKTFSYLKIKQQAYTGYKVLKIGEKPFLIADPEKALVDYLYFVALSKKPPNERLNLQNLNKKKIVEFSKLYNRPKLTRFVRSI